MLKAILFDVGGTLLGASDLLENLLGCHVHPQAHVEVYNQLGREFFRQVADCRNGGTFKKVVEMIEGAVEVVNQEHHGCLASVNAARVYWDTYVSDSFVIHDADLALPRLHEQNIELIVASDADAELIYAQLEKHSLAPYISKYFISSELKAYKPSDGFVSAVNNAIGKYPREAVILVGDSDIDIETGKKLGIKTARVGRDLQKRYQEDYVLESLLELLEL
jgi:putative hydrolase of the HAD superfamily